jgi:hypothetical protein
VASDARPTQTNEPFPLPPDNLAEIRFSWLLKQRGYSYWTEGQLEERVQIRGKRPDYYVETPHHGAFLAEVESFEKAGPLDGLGRFAAYDGDRVFKRIRTAVGNGAEQLRPYSDLCIPMLIILDNWRRVGIPSNVIDLRNALFGTLEFRFPVNHDTGAGVMEDAGWHHGGGQFFNEQEKRYVSAVAWNVPKNPYIEPPSEERIMRLIVVHNPWADVRFPIQIFNSADDEHYGYLQECGGLRWVDFSTTESHE